MKVMVVDDDSIIVEAVKTLLKTEGHDAIGVYSGEECLDNLGREKVDLILLDIKMPGMDGVELMKLIKEKYHDLPVILITGFFLDEHLKETNQADGFLRKPFEPDKIIDLLKNLSPQTTFYNE